MKLLVVAYKFGSEEEIGRHLGTYSYFIETLRILKRLGHEVVVIAPWLTFFKKGSSAVDGVKVKRYYPPLLNSVRFFPLNRVMRFWYLKRTSHLVLQFNREKSFDAVLVWQARETGYAVAEVSDKLTSPFLFRQITAWQWHFKRPIEEVYSDRGWYRFLEKFRLTNFFNPFIEILYDRKSQIRFAKTIYQKAAKIIFVSRTAMMEERSLGFDEEKAKILSVGIETNLFSPQKTKKEWRQQLAIRGEKVILFIGRINFAEKGIGYLIEAMSEIIESVSSANLVVIGEGREWRKMLALIEKLKIQDHVQLVGKKPFLDLPKYLNAADILVVPSVWVEHFGQVTIEAMSCGIPVVTSNTGGSTEINLDGKTGFVVPSADSKKIAEAVIKILQNETLQRNLGEAARKQVLENYSYEALAQELLVIIQKAKSGL